MAASLNDVELIGWLHADPDVKPLAQGVYLLSCDDGKCAR
jgi:hypothetical protein